MKEDLLPIVLEMRFLEKRVRSTEAMFNIEVILLFKAGLKWDYYIHLERNKGLKQDCFNRLLIGNTISQRACSYSALV